MARRDLDPAEYPEALQRSQQVLEHLTVSGDIDPRGQKVIAVVGARAATQKAAAFAFELARACVKAGAIVASGGAIGIDAAAHRGALSAKGRTWAVLGIGADSLFPNERAELFSEIERTEGCSLLWPFRPDRPFRPGNYAKRNGYLVALADEVVVVQAGLKSGSLNTARQARRAGRRPWIVPTSPWQDADQAELYQGNYAQLEMGGARVLSSIDRFLAATGLTAISAAVPSRVPPSFEDDLDLARSDEEKALLLAATNRPKHLDDLCEIAGLSPALAATAILTLALEHVLVEGPPGYYRRGSAG